MKVNKIKNLRIVSSMIMFVLILAITSLYYFVNTQSVAVSNSDDSAIYNGNRNSNKIALMFNCYEGREIIIQIAEILEKYEFRATFFWGGCFADDNLDLVKTLAERGHEIGNHGYFHKKHRALGYDGNLQEIQKTHEIIRAGVGVEMRLFAPPSGDFSKTTLKVCKNLGYKVILWSKDTVDWRDKNPKIVYNRATTNISGGDFVLLHPKEHTLKALPDIIENYLASGFVVSTVSQCMENNG